MTVEFMGVTEVTQKEGREREREKRELIAKHKQK